MTWYFLVMASVAVAAVLAGFCMGRLTGGSEMVPETGVEGAGGMEFSRDRKGADGRSRMAVAGLWGLRDRNAVRAAGTWEHTAVSGSADMQGDVHVESDAGMPGDIHMPPNAPLQDNIGTSVPGGRMGTQDGTYDADMPDGAGRVYADMLDGTGQGYADRIPDGAGQGYADRMPDAPGAAYGDNSQRRDSTAQRRPEDGRGSTVRSLGEYTRQPDRSYPGAMHSGGSHFVRKPSDRNWSVGNQPGTVLPGRGRAVRNPSGLYQIRRGRGRQAVEEECTWSVGSPVSGEVAAVYEGEHPAVQILPAEDRLYAPVGGKVVYLFPMGNGLLFRTDFGTELYIQVGNSQDELLGRHYRPRVVKNEIVGKGKVLLQFDRKGLVAEGVSPMVTVSVANCAYGSNAQPAASEWVSSGEEILKVQGWPE